ncbi:MAG: Asp-tRNA(Asn)/Glu-tRNA(Gln) amidotransferase subunit GatC [Acidimicrobiia bacterium]|nr:Asp-tRNA(Asn)/Glu-tRNA(Gln) amidotransferase subunit GatC [Acidimicrobiia bacterium]
MPCSSSTPPPTARPASDRHGVSGRGRVGRAPLASAGVSERISTADVVHVANLARLALSAEEIERTTAQLADMLEHFADIDELELDDVAPMTQPFPLVNVLRDDEVRPGLERDEVLAAAPDAVDGRFRVPPIVGLDG